MVYNSLQDFIYSHSLDAPKGFRWINTVVTHRDIDADIGIACKKNNLTHTIVDGTNKNKQVVLDEISRYLEKGFKVFVNVDPADVDSMFTILNNWKEYTSLTSLTPNAGAHADDHGRLFLVVHAPEGKPNLWTAKQVSDYTYEYA